MTKFALSDSISMTLPMNLKLYRNFYGLFLNIFVDECQSGDTGWDAMQNAYWTTYN